MPTGRGCYHSPAIRFNWHIAGSEIVIKCAPAPLERCHKLLSLNWYLSLSAECMSGPSGTLPPPPHTPTISFSLSLRLFAILYFAPGKQSASHSPVVKVKLWWFLSMTKYLPSRLLRICPRRAAGKKKGYFNMHEVICVTGAGAAAQLPSPAPLHLEQMVGGGREGGEGEMVKPGLIVCKRFSSS